MYYILMYLFVLMCKNTWTIEHSCCFPSSAKRRFVSVSFRLHRKYGFVFGRGDWKGTFSVSTFHFLLFFSKCLPIVLLCIQEYLLGSGISYYIRHVRLLAFPRIKNPQMKVRNHVILFRFGGIFYFEIKVGIKFIRLMNLIRIFRK